ncbi:MAG: hypothetical protein SPF22_08160 [Candidatus Onthovivens sp.]|nr:hypothetical protein [Candidatus Onthovivens sp.]
MASFFGRLFDLFNDESDSNWEDVLLNGFDHAKDNNFSSIASKASEGILQFPVLTSDTVGYENAVLVSKALERAYASFTQVVFSMNKELSDVHAKNVSDYLHKFHQNTNSNLDSRANGIPGRSFESFTFSDPKRNAIYTCNITIPSGVNNRMVAKLKEQLKPYLEDFCMTKINDLYQPRSVINAKCLIDMEGYYGDNRYEYDILTESRHGRRGGRHRGRNNNNNDNDNNKEPFNTPRIVNSDKDNDKNNPSPSGDNNNPDTNKPSGDKNNPDKKQHSAVEKERNKRNNHSNGNNNNLRNRFFLPNNRNTGNLHGGYSANPNELIKAPILTAQDVKKSNELQPTMLTLQIQRTKDGQLVRYEINVGIKTTLHLVPSEEFITNMVDACEYKGTLFRYIRWSTGEIEFIRDFVLRMDQFKKETRNRVVGNSKWWEALKSRARSANISRVKADRLLPNTTLVFSLTEVDHIKANYGYDLLSFKMANQLMKEYFLLGYVVVDDASEVVHILYDGQTKFQTFTFRALQRENSDESNVKTFSKLLKAARQM